MIKKPIKKIALGLMVGALLMPTASSNLLVGASDDSIMVTYHLTDFASQQVEYSVNQTADSLTISDFHRKIEDYKMAKSSFKIEYYTDELMQSAYDFTSPLTADLELYGKITSQTVTGSNDVYGWENVGGTIFVGEHSLNEVVSSSKLSFPMTVENNGEANFNFVDGGYSVNYRGYDVSQPFSITVDFGDVKNIYQPTIFNITVFPYITLAQAGTVYGHQGGGAKAYLRFYVDNTYAGRALNIGRDPNETSPDLHWLDTNKNNSEPTSQALKTALETESKVKFTFNVGDDKTIIKLGDTDLIEVPVTKTDFPSGYAYFSVGSEFGGGLAKVKLEQTYGAVTASTNNGITATNFISENGNLICDIAGDVSKGVVVKLNGESLNNKIENGKCIIDMPNVITEDFTLDFSMASTPSESKGESGGCGSSFNGGYLAMIIMLAIVAVSKNKKRKLS